MVGGGAGHTMASSPGNFSHFAGSRGSGSAVGGDAGLWRCTGTGVHARKRPRSPAIPAIPVALRPGASGQASRRDRTKTGPACSPVRYQVGPVSQCSIQCIRFCGTHAPESVRCGMWDSEVDETMRGCMQGFIKPSARLVPVSSFPSSL